MTAIERMEAQAAFEPAKATVLDALASSDTTRIAIVCLAEGMALQKELTAAKEREGMA